MAATLVLTRSDPLPDLANAAIRRRFLLAGFAVLALVLTAGLYFTVRSMARERAVAKLQSEFVSAFSHGFRTPLTALRQISEMRVNERIPSEGERRQSYDILLHASERLQRLVESLLDFGRMESSAFRYRFEEVDVGALVGRVVEEFRRQAAQGHQVELAQAGDLPRVSADREALGVALWNLLDNAVKYSPACPSVWVETKREGSGIGIAVRDSGLGIAPGEQRRIFEKCKYNWRPGGTG
jgi:signal transduction histidine kinase